MRIHKRFPAFDAVYSRKFALRADLQNSRSRRFACVVTQIVFQHLGKSQEVLVTGIVLACLSVPLAAYSAGLVPLNDNQMAGVSGQSGIMLSLQSRNNVDSTNTPFANCSDPNNKICRLALQFDGQADKWLVLKQYFGTLEIDKIELTNGVLPSVASAYANPQRFENADGASCALGGVWPNCTTVTGQTVVQLSYPLDVSNPGTYGNLTTFLNIGQEAIEADSGGVPGYALNNNTGSIQAIRISDSLGANHSAGMRFDGQAYLFGF